ncbi:MAG: acyl-CoA desaturase, partial [Chloroflexi bacterium]
EKLGLVWNVHRVKPEDLHKRQIAPVLQEVMGD